MPLVSKEFTGVSELVPIMGMVKLLGGIEMLTHADSAALATLDQLREFVLETLCAQDGLDPHQVQLLEHPLRRQQSFAGILWEVRGPRRLRCQAIWSAAERRLYFYNSAGQRTRLVRLTVWPRVA